MTEIRTIVKSELRRYFLFVGLRFAIPGSLLLMFAGIFTPLHLLERYGLLIFTFATALISYGLIPYRRLSRIELKPQKIIFTRSALSYKGHTYLFGEIEAISFIKRGRRFGIRLTYQRKKIFMPYFSESQSEQCRAYVQGQRGVSALLQEEV